MIAKNFPFANRYKLYTMTGQINPDDIIAMIMYNLQRNKESQP